MIAIKLKSLENALEVFENYEEANIEDDDNYECNMDNLEAELIDESLNPNLPNLLRCAAHTLQLCVEDTIKVEAVQTLILEAREVS